ncbi:MAG: hypothetical protein GX605_00490 [Chloroflexi bacterium]|nr:hypothetical protein [Chloroflexota bacterium]
MLHEALRLMAESRVGSLRDLAEHLEVSEDLAEMILSQLQRLGYVRTDRLGCSGGCAGCPVAQGCVHRESLRLWTLTPKGQAALAGKG